MVKYTLHCIVYREKWANFYLSQVHNLTCQFNTSPETYILYYELISQNDFQYRKMLQPRDET